MIARAPAHAERLGDMRLLLSIKRGVITMVARFITVILIALALFGATVAASGAGADTTGFARAAV
jgi:hypothetical protein